MSGVKGRSGGARPGAGRRRQYVRVPTTFHVERSAPQHVTPESDLTICIAEADDRRGIVIDEVWYGHSEALAIAEYIEQFREWLSHKGE